MPLEKFTVSIETPPQPIPSTEQTVTTSVSIPTSIDIDTLPQDPLSVTLAYSSDDESFNELETVNPLLFVVGKTSVDISTLIPTDGYSRIGNEVETAVKKNDRSY